MSDTGARAVDGPEPAEAPAPAVPQGDGQRRLERMRLVATGLVAAMAGVYVLTLLPAEPGFLILLVRAAAEAGVVGGLADWFAVTALFRHPLGLPFPHTAVIPRNQLRIGESLGRFVERNFVTRDLVLRKVRQLSVGHRTAAWLSSPKAGRMVGQWVVEGLPALLRGLETEELHGFARRAFGQRMGDADVAPILGRVLRHLATTPEADRLLDRGLLLLKDQIASNRERILEMVADRSRWWVPKSVDRRIAEGIADGLADLVASFERPESEPRHRLREALLAMSSDLENDPQARVAIHAALARVAASPELEAWLLAVWRDMAASIRSDLENPDSQTRRALEQAVASLGRTLSNDPDAIAFIDRLAQKGALLVVARRQDVAAVVSEVVKSWDADTLSRRLEIAVGSDLQYIRISGTLVGAAVGCALFITSRLLGFDP